MSNARIYVFCGKMASGKSTLARQLSEAHSLTLLSEDVLLGALYPDQIVDVRSYAEYSGKLKLAMTPVMVNLLRTGTSLVLDFPANTIRQRQWIKDIAGRANADIKFHYLNVSDSVCLARLKERAVKEPQRRATDTAQMFDAMSQYFEPPTRDEGFEIVDYPRQ